MYGVSVPYDWHKEWEQRTGKEFYETFESFMDDSAFTSEIKHKDGIFCLFDGRDGRCIIIGRVLEKSGDGDYIGCGSPLELPVKLTDMERELIGASIERNFGLTAAPSFWFVTILR